MVGGVAILLGGMVYGRIAMPESNLAPVIGILFCPVGALGGWVVGMMIDYLRNR